jgi:hypothetical protein
MDQAGIQDHQSKKVFSLFKELMPNLPVTYSKFTNIFRIKKCLSQKACLVCKKLLEKQSCENSECIKKKKIKPLSNYAGQHPIFIKFEFIQHLKYMLEDKWLNIIEYKGKKSIKLGTIYRMTPHIRPRTLFYFWAVRSGYYVQQCFFFELFRVHFNSN